MSHETQAMFAVGKIEPIEPDKLIFDPNDLPLLPTRDMVLFPGVTVPISLGRDGARRITEAALAGDILIGVVCQRSAEDENPNLDGLHSYGVTARVLQVFEVPDGSKMAIVSAFNKFRIIGPGTGTTMPAAALSAQVKLLRDTAPRPSDKEFMALVHGITRTTLTLIENATGSMTELAMNVKEADNPLTLINLIATHGPFGADFKIELLKESRIKERAFRLMAALARDEQKSVIYREVMDKTKTMLDEHQRKAFLRAQLDTIKEELFGEDEDIAALRERAKAVAFPDGARARFDKELTKLERMQPLTPDYSVQHAYLQALLGLPWGIHEQGNTDFNKAAELLESEHYGLEKVKERILEQIAVMMNAPGCHAPILCLVGAPGVGKTSLGASIARAMGRKYVRVALGGLHDEAEIRGHRRTYIGAMPGRIIAALTNAGTANPLILLDEIDKVGSDFRGDPSAALLEVLDPEQNYRFHDNYVDIDFDLSQVLFIATANSLASIPQPLVDRMEVIDISGYLMEEKVQIALRHLLPRLRTAMGVGEEEVQLTEEALTAIIETYTCESGVRQLEKRLAALLRKAVLIKLRDNKPTIRIEPSQLKDYLGAPPFFKERYEGAEPAGVVTGLAWTQAGGEILYVESSLSRSKGEKLTLTGNLGDVMKESAAIALQYVKAHADELGIDATSLEDKVLHIHVPEGAIPKDGPSAGITMATSIVSAITGRPVREGIAMTGEITLRGKVLPVGGIKEKILAAKRAGINTIILSKANRKDVEEIKETYRKGLSFIYVDTVMEVLSHALPQQEK